MSDAPSTPPPGPAGGDHEAVQGFWKLVAYTAAGRPVAHGDLGTVYRFVGNRFRHIRTRLGCHFKLHPEMSPKGIDFVQPSTRSTSMGIYDLDGDTLKICRAGWSRPRPTSFDDPDLPVEAYTRFKRKLRIKRRAKAQIPKSAVDGGFIPKDLFP